MSPSLSPTASAIPAEAARHAGTAAPVRPRRRAIVKQAAEQRERWLEGSQPQPTQGPTGPKASARLDAEDAADAGEGERLAGHEPNHLCPVIRLPLWSSPSSRRRSLTPRSNVLATPSTASNTENSSIHWMTLEILWRISPWRETSWLGVSTSSNPALPATLRIPASASFR